MAVWAIEMNARLNKVDFEVTSENFLERDVKEFDVILFGDMFYDATMAAKLSGWISKLKRMSKTVLVGDPNRFAFKDESGQLLTDLSLLKTYQLPDCVRHENHGLTEASVYGCNF